MGCKDKLTGCKDKADKKKLVPNVAMPTSLERTGSQCDQVFYHVLPWCSVLTKMWLTFYSSKFCLFIYVKYSYAHLFPGEFRTQVGGNIKI